MDWTVLERHELTCLLSLHVSPPARIAAALQAGGLDSPAPQGVEPAFGWWCRLVCSASGKGQLSELVEASRSVLGSAGLEALEGLVGPPPAPAAPEEDSDEEAETIRDEEMTIREDSPTIRQLPPVKVGDAAEAQAEEAEEGEALSTLARAEAAGIVLEPGVPRPPGTPAAAASREGAESYLVRRVHLGVPTEVSPGEKLEVEVSIVPAAPGTVPNSPEGAPEYVGEPVEVLIELVADGAVVPDARLSAIPVELSAEGERLTRVFTVAADAELGAGVDISVHFFVGGYEVGRARAFVVNREADEGEVRPGTPGSVVVPDTILGYQ